MNALESYFAETGESTLTLARRMGRAPTTITRPLHGQRNASMDVALGVEAATGGRVTAEQFMEICLAAKRNPTPIKSRGGA